MTSASAGFTNTPTRKTSGGKAREISTAVASEICRGPLPYTGRDVRKTHTGMNITEGEFDAFVGHIAAAMKKNKVAEADVDELLKTVKEVKIFIVGK